MPFDPSVTGRFWKHVAVADDDACWLWRGQAQRNGYGVLMVHAVRPRRIATVRAHRLAWALFNGGWPSPHLFVCHRCDVRLCCNPRHLFLGTRQDNADDAVRKGRTALGDRNGARQHPERLLRGAAQPMAVLTEEAVREIRARAAAGERQAEIGRAYGVAQHTISRIINGKRWRHSM